MKNTIHKYVNNKTNNNNNNNNRNLNIELILADSL